VSQFVYRLVCFSSVFKTSVVIRERWIDIMFIVCRTSRPTFIYSCLFAHIQCAMLIECCLYINTLALHNNYNILIAFRLYFHSDGRGGYVMKPYIGLGASPGISEGVCLLILCTRCSAVRRMNVRRGRRNSRNRGSRDFRYFGSMPRFWQMPRFRNAAVNFCDLSEN